MNIKKQYPKLFKTLARLFGARRAKKLLQNLKKVGCSLLDSKYIDCAFVWSHSTKDSCYRKTGRFWSKANSNAKKRIKGY